MANDQDRKVFAERYEVIGRLGSGGMAEVYRARDNELDREVAIKVLQPRLGGDAQFIERFRREARSAAGLSHPNIVQVYDWGREGDIYFIVMELVRGENLREAINTRGPLSPEETISITLQVCQALDYAHEHGVIHRDIKPHNIMMTPSGHIKVADFGIAQAQHQNAETVTNEGYLVGTAQYCSPEQAQGRPVVRNSDLYSLGIVAYEMLTKKVPFEADNPVAVAVMQVQQAPKPPRELRPDIPRALESVIMKSLEKDPEARFPNAQQMARALEAARGDRMAVEDTSSATIVTAVAGGAGHVSSDERPTTISKSPFAADGTVHGADTDIEEASNRRRRLIIIGAVLLLLLLGALGAWAMTSGRVKEELPAQTKVPSVAGLTLEEANRAIEKAGLELGRSVDEPSAEAEEGTVFKQEPAAGDLIAAGTKVDLWVSTGPETVQVPSVVGEGLEGARAILRGEELELGEITRVNSATVDKDEVISQQPEAGSEAETGDRINLTVSNGPEPVETVVVPSVQGMLKSDATSKLQSRGLRVSEEDEFSDSAPRGTVVRQSPDAGQTVDKDSTVTIFLSKGPSQVVVPEVTALPQSAAKRKIAELGLKWRVVEQVDSSFNEGITIGTDPAEGTKVPSGSTITILVAKAPPTTTTSSTTSTTTSSTTSTTLAP